MVKNQLAMLETQVQSLHRGDSLEKGMAIHYSILAWRIPWTEEPGRLQSMGLHRVGHDWNSLAQHTHSDSPNFSFLWLLLSYPTWNISGFMCSYGEDLCVLMEKAMATHSSTLAWKTPWMEQPGRLQSMGSLRVGHNWATSLFTFMHWRRKWQPIPVFLPGESQGRGSLVGCRLWGRTESDTTEVT